MKTQTKEKLIKYFTSLRDSTTSLSTDYNALLAVYVNLDNVSMSLSTKLQDSMDKEILREFAYRIDCIKDEILSCSRFLTELGAYDSLVGYESEGVVTSAKSES